MLAAALTVFHRDGVAVSTATVAKAAGVSVGTLFNYFPTKQALIDGLYLSIKTDMASAIAELDHTLPIETRVRQVWDRWFLWARGDRKAHAVVTLLHHAGLTSAEAQAAGLVALRVPVELLAEAAERGLLVDLPLDYLGALVEQQLDQAITAGLTDAESDLAFSVLWNGISNKPNQLPKKAKT